MVFHRILDFKTRLDFYPASIFLYTLHCMLWYFEILELGDGEINP